MRKLCRPEEPESLREVASRCTENYLHSRRENPKARFQWPSGCYSHIRERLAAMTQRHCAFCDGPLGIESRETVEHFRPKSLFPELAFAWHNLFPCCDVCQSHKLERFNELLLKPDDDDYSFGRYFVVNYKTGEIEVSPGADDSEKGRAEVSCLLYGLNIPERKKARIRELEFFRRTENPVLDDFNYRFFLEMEDVWA